jgi:hypothetical protein
MMHGVKPGLDAQAMNVHKLCTNKGRGAGLDGILCRDGSGFREWARGIALAELDEAWTIRHDYRGGTSDLNVCSETRAAGSESAARNYVSGGSCLCSRDPAVHWKDWHRHDG